MTYQAKKILFIGSVIFKEILQHMLKKDFKAIITKKEEKLSQIILI